MGNYVVDLLDRCEGFSIRIMDLFRLLNVDSAGRVIGRQLLRSATSIGANYEESQGAESREDFIHKVKISYKEARESAYWLRLIKRDKKIKVFNIDELSKENEELVKILGKIISTAKGNKGKEQNAGLGTFAP